LERALPVSSKVTAASVASALATIFWTVAIATFAKNTFSDVTVAVLTGATTTVLTFVLGYFVPESNKVIQAQYRRIQSLKQPESMG
jgi:hypothetical protein